MTQKLNNVNLSYIAKIKNVLRIFSNINNTVFLVLLNITNILLPKCTKYGLSYELH
jgi:hypothetical protein